MLLDISMPGMSGEEVYKLRADVVYRRSASSPIPPMPLPEEKQSLVEAGFTIC